MIRGIEQVKVQGESSSMQTREVEGSFHNDMGLAGDDAIEISNMANSFLSGIPMETYAMVVLDASCFANPESTYPTDKCESESELDVKLWSMELNTPFVCSSISRDKFPTIPCELVESILSPPKLKSNESNQLE
ncbi:hypothetical protein SUGI_0957710 [Cryptomeria japonica]|nr:hypothetical protein SUGI_0957710 [Cryptomeria japonica]